MSLIALEEEGATVSTGCSQDICNITTYQVSSIIRDEGAEDEWRTNGGQGREEDEDAKRRGNLSVRRRIKGNPAILAGIHSLFMRRNIGKG